MESGSLSLVLYGVFALMEEHRLRVSAIKVLRIFGPEREEVTEG
jgi:hypothetical protein